MEGQVLEVTVFHRLPHKAQGVIRGWVPARKGERKMDRSKRAQVSGTPALVD